MRARGKPHNVTSSRRPRVVLFPVGRRHRTLTTTLLLNSSTPGSGGRDAGPTQRPARAIDYEQPRRGPRSFLDPAHRRQQQQGHGVESKSPHFRLATPSPSPTSRPPETPRHTTPATPTHGETSTYPLDKHRAISASRSCSVTTGRPNRNSRSSPGSASTCSSSSSASPASASRKSGPVRRRELGHTSTIAWQSGTSLVPMVLFGRVSVADRPRQALQQLGSEMLAGEVSDAYPLAQHHDVSRPVGHRDDPRHTLFLVLNV